MCIWYQNRSLLSRVLSILQKFFDLDFLLFRCIFEPILFFFPPVNIRIKNHQTPLEIRLLVCFSIKVSRVILRRGLASTATKTAGLTACSLFCPKASHLAACGLLGFFLKFYDRLLFVQQCCKLIGRQTVDMSQLGIAPRIGAEEYDKLIAGI